MIISVYVSLWEKNLHWIVALAQQCTQNESLQKLLLS